MLPSSPFSPDPGRAWAEGVAFDVAADFKGALWCWWKMQERNQIHTDSSQAGGEEWGGVAAK